MKPITLLIIGAGGRGSGYARFAQEYPERVQIVGVADPREYYRNTMAKTYAIPPENVFTTWEEAAARPRFADAVVIATPDRIHEAPAVAFARLGYNMLLEKPLAPTLEACRHIVEEVKKADITFAVCHVMRYTQYTQKLIRLVRSGRIGDIVSVQHLEPVGFFHQCHSFVRGNWHNEKQSSFMLLQKSCHDLDWLRYVVNLHCQKVQSFGSLSYFNAAHQPKGAADRCTDCPPEIESLCPASALKIYVRDRAAKGKFFWPVDIVCPEPSIDALVKALREGPYGKCAFKCDNDVVDHQVVNLEFEKGVTAQFTMTAFNPGGDRKTRIFGTKGELDGDGRMITIHDFLTDETETIDSQVSNEGGILSGHGGGDGGLMESFISALETGDRSKILSGVDETLESHTMVFRAEESRRSGQVLDI